MSLCQLPVEIILVICEYLEPFDLLHVSHVSKRLYDIMNDEYLWKGLCSSAFHCRAVEFHTSPRLHYFSVHKAVQHIIHSKQTSKIRDTSKVEERQILKTVIENENHLFENCQEALEYFLDNKEFIKAEHLLEHGLSLNKMDDEGCTLLHRFITKIPRNLRAIKWLLYKDADINLPDFISWTPLHYAVTMEDSRIISYLISQNADLNARDYRGDTPYDLALSITTEEIILKQLEPQKKDKKNINNNNNKL